MRMISLPELRCGQRGVVTRVEPDACLADRLTELGFIPGAVVCRRYSDRVGSLSAYAVADSCIALRKCDAAYVRVRPE